MSLSLIDLLFLITVVLLVLSGLRNGAVFSLINLVSIPLAFGVAYFWGPQFTAFLSTNNLTVNPFVSYIVLFFGTVLVLHIVASTVRGVVQRIPVIGLGDALLGGIIGVVEAWLLWVFLLVVLGGFLNSMQGAVQQGSNVVPGLNIQVSQLTMWHTLYNQTVTNSLFARVNGFFVKELPHMRYLSSLLQGL